MNMLNGTRTVTKGWTAAIMISLLVIAAVAVAVCADESDGDTSASLSYTQSSGGLNVITYGPLDTTYSRPFITIEDEAGSVTEVMGTSGNEYLMFVLTEGLDENGIYRISIGSSMNADGDILSETIFVNGDVSIDSIDVDTEMDVGDTAQLSVTTTPAALADLVEVTYSSDEPGIVSVSDGTVTAESEGTAMITATIEVNGTTYSQTVTIAVGGSVVPDVPVTGVSLDKTSASLNVGGTVTLTATVSPSNATNKDVTWSSDDETVATVENGVVTAVSGGTATITVTTVDGGLTATCEVTVTEDTIEVTGVTLDKSEMTLFTDGVTGKLTATVSPSNATNKDVTWESSDPSIATVLNGVVTPVSAGTTTITVTTVDGGYTATCVVTVEEVAQTGVEIVPDKDIYTVGDVFDAGVSVYALYNNGDRIILTEGYEVTFTQDGQPVVDGQTLETSGTIIATVTCNGFTATHEITVREPGQVVIDVTVLGGGVFGTLYLTTDDGQTTTFTASGRIVVDEGTVVTITYDTELLIAPTLTLDGEPIWYGKEFIADSDARVMISFIADDDDDDDDEPVNPSTPVQDGDDDSTTYIVAIAAAAVVAILAALILMQTRKS